MEINESMKWYVIHTYASYESVVKNNLEKMIENNNLQDFVDEIAIPVEEDVVEKNGKRKVIERKKFPGYVFVKMRYTDHVWYMIANTRGVTGFVGPQGKALALTSDEVKRMGLEKITAEDFDIKVGDNIKIVSGALDTFLGTVEEVFADKQKVRVFVQMFGRPTPVELDFTQIEKI
ncbi:MAG: transcription termination/antitermination protein NusG [Christensenellaceae bacterium]|jgi:transcriptional antiterminator NusG|nr:transcription termination/antitermination protein NusG [Christensenellaceae bacterium]